VIQGRVSEISRKNGRPQISTRGGSSQAYDLLAVAAGVNTTALKLFEELGFGYEPPRTMKTAVREYYLGEETVGSYLGSSIHVFLLDIPRLKFACLIPKGDYVTLCLVGDGIDKELVAAVLERPEVEACFPPDFPLDQPSCQCWPRIALQGAVQPFTDRIVFLGDCGVTRFYKDGIGSAYRAAKAAATTAVFQGISAEDFGRHYGAVCRRLSVDNVIGQLVFAIVRQIQKRRFARRAVVCMVSREQQKEARDRRLSMVMWDMYTGGSPYGEIFLRTLHPAFWVPFLGDCAVSLVTGR
jgi:hypothetical protein